MNNFIKIFTISFPFYFTWTKIETILDWWGDDVFHVQYCLDLRITCVFYFLYYWVFISLWLATTITFVCMYCTFIFLILGCLWVSNTFFMIYHVWLSIIDTFPTRDIRSVYAQIWILYSKCIAFPLFRAKSIAFFCIHTARLISVSMD